MWTPRTYDGMLLRFVLICIASLLSVAFFAWSARKRPLLNGIRLVLSLACGAWLLASSVPYHPVAIASPEGWVPLHAMSYELQTHYRPLARECDVFALDSRNGLSVLCGYTRRETVPLNDESLRTYARKYFADMPPELPFKPSELHASTLPIAGESIGRITSHGLVHGEPMLFEHDILPRGDRSVFLIFNALMGELDRASIDAAIAETLQAN